LDRLEEALQICRAMFTEEAPSFEGRHYRVHEARNVPPPVQPGGPPILVGGGGEKRTLRLVAQYADMTNIVGDPATIAHKVGVLRRHCADLERDPSEVTVSRLSTLVLTESPEETLATRDVLRQATGEEPTTADIGTPDELVTRVEELAAAGVDYFIFNMPTGSPDMVRRVGEVLVGALGD
jgi:alkanesulfonate monooxygenase SsuD/methylene tetrahydromethanopterin reductase-like flavin-dependent oxidoreductase (luciferase family)